MPTYDLTGGIQGNQVSAEKPSLMVHSTLPHRMWSALMYTVGALMRAEGSRKWVTSGRLAGYYGQKGNPVHQ